MKSKSRTRSGIIGLGRVGANMIRRLIRFGHEYVVFDLFPKVIEAWFEHLLLAHYHQKTSLKTANRRTAVLRTGVLLLHIEPGSPASRAGLRAGDVIVGFGGESVSGIDELHRHLVAKVIGVPSVIAVIRHTEKLELVVTPAELTPNNQRN